MLLKEYDSFLEEKEIQTFSNGWEVSVEEMSSLLFDWQKLIIRWSLQKGRAAILADCGLGKTFLQLEWARYVHMYTKEPVLILAPLAVAQQSQLEGKKIRVRVKICQRGEDIINGINITNYEKLHKFDCSLFSGIVLDESGILKNFAGTTRNQLIESFCNTPYRLCCTATPSPNDYTELGNHSEFLGVMTRSEMLSMFFVNDTKDTGNWRLKGHVRDNKFWEWLSSWAIMMRSPSDIGFSDEGYILPNLNIVEKIIDTKVKLKPGELLPGVAVTMDERRKARKESLTDRVREASSMVNSSKEKWLLWCNLNDESAQCAKSIRDAVEVTGSDKVAKKEKSLMDFSAGKIKCLVTKPSIAGHGLNWQIAHNMIFVGLSDSYEDFYQAIRREWRFGQEEDVHVYIIIGKQEKKVLLNIKRKEKEANEMFLGMLTHMRDLMKKEVFSLQRRDTSYNPTVSMKLPLFLGGSK